MPEAGARSLPEPPAWSVLFATARLRESVLNRIQPRSLFWSVLGVAVTGALEDGSLADIGPLADRLEQLFSDSAEELSDVGYWWGMLRENPGRFQFTRDARDRA